MDANWGGIVAQAVGKAVFKTPCEKGFRMEKAGQ